MCLFCSLVARPPSPVGGAAAGAKGRKCELEKLPARVGVYVFTCVVAKPALVEKLVEELCPSTASAADILLRDLRATNSSGFLCHTRPESSCTCTCAGDC